MNYEIHYIGKEKKRTRFRGWGNPDSVELYLSLASKRKKSDLGQEIIDTHTRTYTSLIPPLPLSNYTHITSTRTHTINPEFHPRGPTVDPHSCTPS